ncbi:hypothetical protein [Streptomyces sp. NPDC058291]|uniref:hypothetical protein n=1 Tax=Streptomyces sp. NPDC058291 TaxID=3346427 RepID=UPI0036E01117
MSAEHERVKDPLPTRPPRPHPQGFVLCLDDDGHAELSRKVAQANKRSEERPR